MGYNIINVKNDETIIWDKDKIIQSILVVLIMMCFGASYSWSVIASKICMEKGVLKESHLDWTLQESTFPLTLIIGVSGIYSSIFGKY